MAFTDWDSYDELLGKLFSAETQWSGARDFADFDGKIRQNCSDLVPKYDELRAQLVATGDYDDNDALFEHVRIAVFARSAESFGLGPEWAGYWVSKDLSDAEIYAAGRFAAPDAWSPVEVPVQDAALAATPDLTEQHFDTETNRWRRWDDTDGEFEHYHDNDGVWERGRDGLWHRFHDGVGQWLPYDEPSETWLYLGKWRPHDDIPEPVTGEGTPDLAPDEDLDALAERLVAEALGELDDEDDEPLSPEEQAEAVAIVRRNLQEEAMTHD